MKKIKFKLLRAWFSFLARYTRKKNHSGVWPLFFLLLALLRHKMQTATKSSALDYTVPILMKCRSYAYNLESLDDGLYRFYRSSSLDYMQEDINLRKAECGYEFPNDLESQMQAGEDGCISVYTSPSTVLTAVVNEAVYNAIFQEYAKTMLADFIASYDVVSLKKADELKALVNEHYEYEKENTPVFHVVYEDIPENFYDDQALFQIPVRGLAVLFIMLTALAGSSQFRHDAKKGRIPSSPSRRKMVCPFCNSLSSSLCFFLFLVCLHLFIGFCRPNKCNTYRQKLALLIVFSALCSILCTLLGQIIKSSLAFDALIPVILLFCLLYSPVLMDLGDFIPGYKVLSWLAPTKWYFTLHEVILS